MSEDKRVLSSKRAAELKEVGFLPLNIAAIYWVTCNDDVLQYWESFEKLRFNNKLRTNMLDILYEDLREGTDPNTLNKYGLLLSASMKIKIHLSKIILSSSEGKERLEQRENETAVTVNELFRLSAEIDEKPHFLFPSHPLPTNAGTPFDAPNGISYEQVQEVEYSTPLMDAMNQAVAQFWQGVDHNGKDAPTNAMVENWLLNEFKHIGMSQNIARAIATIIRHPDKPANGVKGRV